MIDEEGNLFGAVNVVDVLFVLSVLALVVGAALLVTGATDADTTTEQGVTATADVHPSVADAIAAADERGDGDVRAVSLDARTAVNRNTTEVTLSFALDVERRDGLLFARGERLYVGRELTLDLNRTIVDVTVTGLEADS